MNASNPNNDWNAMTPRQKAVAILLGAFIFIGGWFLIAWLQSPQESTNTAIFHPTRGHARNNGETVMLTLPRGWKARYNGHQPFREATLFNEHSVGQFELSIDLRKGGGVAPAGVLHTFVFEEKSSPNVRLIAAAPKSTPRGTAWWGVSQDIVPQERPIFIMDDNSPRDVRVLHLTGAQVFNGDLIVFRYRAMLNRRTQLEPIAWQIFAEAQVSKQ